MFKKHLTIIALAVIFSMSIMPSVVTAEAINQLMANEVETYLMGKFDPAKHGAFARVPSRYANRSGYYLRQETLNAFARMHEAASKDGVRLIIRSATRNFNYQRYIWERKWRERRKSGLNPKAKALSILNYNSMPGTSRHHWGTEIDLNSFNNRWFEYGKGLKLYRWLQANAAKFGFHQPYTAKNSKRPHGYNEEKWHWSYTPLSIPMLRDATIAISDSKIRGFIGSETATQIGILKHYILGVSESCR